MKAKKINLVLHNPDELCPNCRAFYAPGRVNRDNTRHHKIAEGKEAELFFVDKSKNSSIALKLEDMYFPACICEETFCANWKWGSKILQVNAKREGERLAISVKPRALSLRQARNIAGSLCVFREIHGYNTLFVARLLTPTPRSARVETDRGGLLDKDEIEFVRIASDEDAKLLMRV